MMYQVNYVREEHYQDLYRVRCIALGQTIVVNKRFLVGRIGMDARTIIGCQELSINAIIELGFVVSESFDRLVI